MRTEIKAGLILLSVGILLLVGFLFLGVRFLVGSAHNPPLPSPLRELVYFYFFVLGRFIPMFIFVGAVLIVYGLIQRVRDSKKDTDT